MKGGDALTAYETISLMIMFGMFVISILSFRDDD
ncbi:putative holin-like toxin [Bacillus sp. JCM 19034]